MRVASMGKSMDSVNDVSVPIARDIQMALRFCNCVLVRDITRGLWDSNITTVPGACVPACWTRDNCTFRLEKSIHVDVVSVGCLMIICSKKWIVFTLTIHYEVV
jgi:hypothetical protein